MFSSLDRNSIDGQPVQTGSVVWLVVKEGQSMTNIRIESQTTVHLISSNSSSFNLHQQSIDRTIKKYIYRSSLVLQQLYHYYYYFTSLFSISSHSVFVLMVFVVVGFLPMPHRMPLVMSVCMSVAN